LPDIRLENLTTFSPHLRNNPWGWEGEVVYAHIIGEETGSEKLKWFI
jgi:hypothetical protein